MLFRVFSLLICIFFSSILQGNEAIKTGADQLLSPAYHHLLKGKRIGLITNHTAVDSKLTHTMDLILANEKKLQCKLVALFSPEHGFNGSGRAWEKIQNSEIRDSIPLYSLYGHTRRPTKEMLENIDLLIFDILDIGSRSYTYLSTLCYCMEEAAKFGIPLIVTDRPNPIGGITVDGPMLEDKWRTFVGYINVPYCHGMTIGELALFFNAEYHVGCSLTVIPMKGWKRNMLYRDTGLPWIPTSPHIPEPDTPLFYPTTGLLGELQMVSIGVGYTLPFKVIGAPWIDADRFAEHLNRQSFPGVSFQPFHFRPYYGRYAKEDCHGVLIVIKNPHEYKPVSTQYLIIGILKSLYPKKFEKALRDSSDRRTMFAKVNGTDNIYDIIEKQQYIVWSLRNYDAEKRESFMQKRKKYLISTYAM